MTIINSDNKESFINRKKLADIMSEYQPAYHIYEYEEFIEVFTSVIEQVIKEQKTVLLDGFGSFKPKNNPSFSTVSLSSNDGYVTYPESTTIKFTPSDALKKRIKNHVKLTKKVLNEITTN